MYFGNLYIIYLFSSARISSLAQRERERERERQRDRERQRQRQRERGRERDRETHTYTETETERALKAPRPLLLFYISGKWGSRLSNNVVRKVGVCLKRRAIRESCSKEFISLTDSRITCSCDSSPRLWTSLKQCLPGSVKFHPLLRILFPQRYNYQSGQHRKCALGAKK